MQNYNQTLQTNNSSLEDIITKINELPEAGEDVTDETTAYTTKLAVLDSAITALETELEGKASGGSGGGGSVETCYCSIVCDAPALGTNTITYTNAGMQLATRDFKTMLGTQIEVVKGTIVTLNPWVGTTSCSGDCVKIFASDIGGAFFIAGDSTITYG